MESKVALQVSAAQGPIARAFTSSLKLQVDALEGLIGSTDLATYDGIEVKVGDDHLVIPYRVHYEGSEESGKSLTGVQRTMYACLLTRHHDGHVRQRELQRILMVAEPWVVPFVFQLTGEYVIEILNTCEAHLHELDPVLYGTFIRENPRYFQATRDRMISYWDCCYRWQYPRKTDYVGFRIFERFQEFASGF